MKKIFSLLPCLLLSIAASASSIAPAAFDTVAGDPLKTRFYTLPNGLRVITTVNKDAPRIQTYIAVRVGGKNDPAETTGLAHYFEHLMFKGTPNYGTSDYEAERPLLDSIEAAFEVYRKTSDPAARTQIYARIDSLSHAASLIAIPNEYDKLMSTIGAQGSNAFTSMDVTCYTEDIPSNQIENWARIQSDRFIQPVLRGFHTELETIYEEKNMSLKNDSEKASDALLSALFPDHPYGTQTVLGTQEHLKNPSITNVKRYHKDWYVPNNMAVIMSGDFDPDEAVEIIGRYFGGMEAKSDLRLAARPEPTAPSAPVERTVQGQEAPYIYLGWRIPGGNSDESILFEIMGRVLQNGYCGIIDTNVSQPQRILTSSVFPYKMSDGGIFMLYGEPKTGQSLDEVRDILLAQADSLREGRFSDELVEAVRSNYKLLLQRRFENNEARADMLLDGFVNGRPWGRTVDDINSLDKIGKAEITALARKYLKPEGYAVVYKKQGEDPGVAEIAKPKITPIATNRDAASAFMREIAASEVEPIEPRFVDFEKELTILNGAGDTPIYYTRNTTNDIFTLTFVYETGSTAIPELATAGKLFEFASTPNMSTAEIQETFYSLACSYRMSFDGERTYFTLRGLSENMDKAVKFFYDFLRDARVDDATFETLLADEAQDRKNQKTQEAYNDYALRLYQRYGERNELTNRPSIEALRGIGANGLLDALRRFPTYKHRTIYYGPASEDRVLAVHDGVTPGELSAVPAPKPYAPVSTDETVIYVAPYDMAQADYSMFSHTDEEYSASTEPLRRMYNNYFNGGMNGVVFQEMRESRSLAYTASAGIERPSRKGRNYLYTAYIATQVDKLPEAMSAFEDIIENMPVSEQAFAIARKNAEDGIRTQRVIKDGIAWSYVFALDMGHDTDPSESFYRALQTMTPEDVAKFQKTHVKGRRFSHAILGPLDKIDLESLRRKGRVVVLTTEEIFGE